MPSISAMNQRARFVLVIFHVGRRRRQRHAFDHRHRRYFDDLGAEFERAQAIHRANKSGVVFAFSNGLGPFCAFDWIGDQFDVAPFFQAMLFKIQPDV